MKIRARITMESNEITESEARLLIKYAYSRDKKEISAMKKQVEVILFKMFPNINIDGYIPGPWLDYIADELDMNLNDHGCSDIDF